ncbi:MAG: O-antigen polymerase [Pseudomonadales bacterium]|jgi:oligosaccharide repeat unit polymerase
MFFLLAINIGLLGVAWVVIGKQNRFCFAFLFVSVVQYTLPAVMYPQLYVSLDAFIWVTIYSILFFVGSAVMLFILNRVYSDSDTIGGSVLLPRLDESRVLKVLILGCFCAITSVILSTGEQSWERAVIRIVTGFNEIGIENARERYKYGNYPSSIQSALNAVAYAAICLAGCYWGQVHRFKGLPLSIRIKSFTILLMGSIILFGAVQNAKASILYSVIFFGAGYCSIVWSNGRSVMGVLPSGALLRILGLLVFLFLALLAMHAQRHHATSIFEVFDTILITYGMSHFSGFCFWFDHYEELNSSLTFGSTSFHGLSRYFAHMDPSPASATLPKYVEEGRVTNVDMIYAELIIDFGIYGALAFAFFYGVVVTLLISLARTSRVALALIIVIFSAHIWGFVSSFYTYSSIFMTMFVLYLVYCFACKTRR